MKKIALIAFLILAAASTRAEEKELFRNPAAPIEKRVEDLLRRLTLEEKIRLCHGNVTKDPVELFHAGGKLSFTWGRRLEDYACHALGLWPPRLILDKDPGTPGFTPAERQAIHGFDADYKEGVFMGYRWFDAKSIAPRFAFGHGLSYTTFAFSGLEVKPGGETLRVACTVQNTGQRAGAEVVQVYVAPPAGKVPRPPRELKGFTKVFLNPGASQHTQIEIPMRDLAYYDEPAKKWIVNQGHYEILLGTSSREIKLRGNYNHD